jgi:hypothetical protein
MWDDPEEDGTIIQSQDESEIHLVADDDNTVEI